MKISKRDIETLASRIYNELCGHVSLGSWAYDLILIELVRFFKNGDE